MTHERYRFIQNEVDYVCRLLGRLYGIVREALRLYDTQQRVIALLNLPSFMHEQPAPQPLSFERLYVGRIMFRYEPTLPLALAIGPRHVHADDVERVNDDVDDADDGTLTFERGKTYAIVGQNRSGKSSLVQILCKVYTPSSLHSVITLNDRDFINEIGRIEWRNILSAVSQRPFIFPGSIEENIRVGNTTATSAEVMAAAEAAGVFIFEPPKAVATSAVSLVDRSKYVDSCQAVGAE